MEATFAALARSVIIPVCPSDTSEPQATPFFHYDVIYHVPYKTCERSSFTCKLVMCFGGSQSIYLHSNGIVCGC
jgi:hypothetical protein